MRGFSGAWAFDRALCSRVFFSADWEGVKVGEGGAGGWTVPAELWCRRIRFCLLARRAGGVWRCEVSEP